MLRIVPLDRTNLAAAAAIDAGFDVEAELAVSLGPDGLALTAHAVMPYRKTYADPTDELAAAIADADAAGFVALSDGVVAGTIVVNRDWTGLALVDCFAVAPALRGQGVGQALMERCRQWARARNLPGLRLETQTSNVAACRFYEKQGFVLRGFDADLYRAELPGTREAALFWYFWF